MAVDSHHEPATADELAAVEHESKPKLDPADVRRKPPSLSWGKQVPIKNLISYLSVLFSQYISTLRMYLQSLTFLGWLDRVLLLSREPCYSQNLPKWVLGSVSFIRPGVWKLKWAHTPPRSLCQAASLQLRCPGSSSLSRKRILSYLHLLHFTSCNLGRVVPIGLKLTTLHYK